MNSTKVLLADDHAIVAQGLELLLKDSFNLVGTVRDGRALLEAAARLKPDVIIADISMPLLNGLDAVRQLKSDGIEAKVVILTMHADPHLAADAGAAPQMHKIKNGEIRFSSVPKSIIYRTTEISCLAVCKSHLTI